MPNKKIQTDAKNARLILALASKIESDEERTYGNKSKAISIQDEVLYAAEVIEDEKFLRHSKRKLPRNKIVQITVGYGSSRIGKIVREADGKWNRKAKVWELPYERPWSWDWRKVW